MQVDQKRWFRVRAAITYDTENFVQAVTREEALKVYWRLPDDELDPGEVMDETLLEVEECEPPLK